MVFHEDVDTRSTQLWDIVSRNVDFRKKTVAVLGCGYGGMLWRSLIAGADFVCGFDIEIRDYAKNLAVIYNKIKVVETDLDKDITHGTPYWLNEREWDIVLCLSTISRLEKPKEALKWMAKNFPVAIVGSGFYGIQRMFSLLRSSGFRIVYQIGKLDNDAPYAIWKCQNE